MASKNDEKKTGFQITRTQRRTDFVEEIQVKDWGQDNFAPDSESGSTDAIETIEKNSATCNLYNQATIPGKKNSDEATLALYFVQVLMHYTNGGKFRQKLLDMLHVCMAIVLDQI